MFAKVQRLRVMGVLVKDDRPSVQQWASGIFEFSTSASERGSRARRLVLRHAMANPDKGVIFELFEPRLVDVKDPFLRFRGVEAVSLGGNEIGAMVQEWYVVISG
jgi:hypothetical protein